MKKIIFVTGSRAEFDLVVNILKILDKSNNFNLYVILTGSHLSQDYGNSYKYIKTYKFKNIVKVDIEVKNSTPNNVLKSISKGVEKFTKVFNKLKPDIIFLPGDRYELIAAALCGHFLNIRIAHIFGGDTTTGSLDESIRHCITKLSDYHFVTSQDSKNRVLQLGENKKNIYLIGNPGLDSMKNIKYLTKKYLEKLFDFNFKDKIALIVLHPDASSGFKTVQLTESLLVALKDLKNYSLIFTQPNADSYSNEISQRFKAFCKTNNSRSIYLDNLGHQKFLSFLKISSFIIGNSSAGLSEMPFFKKPTINLGKRQEGRIKPFSVIDCNLNKKNIKNAINKASDLKFCHKIKKQSYHLGKAGGSKKIVSILSKLDISQKKDFKKFIDI